MTLSSVLHYCRHSHYLQVTLLLVTSVASLGIVGWRLSQRPTDLVIEEGRKKTVMHLGRIPDLVLEDVRNGAAVTITRAPSYYHRLFLFLSAGDCGSCVAEVPMFNAVANIGADPDFHAYVIFVHTTRKEARSFISAYKPNYTVLIDMKDSVARSVGLPDKTPITILTSGDLHVQMVQPANGDFAAQERFVNAVQHIVHSDSWAPQ